MHKKQGTANTNMGISCDHSFTNGVLAMRTLSALYARFMGGYLWAPGGRIYASVIELNKKKQFKNNENKEIQAKRIKCKKNK